MRQKGRHSRPFFASALRSPPTPPTSRLVWQGVAPPFPKEFSVVARVSNYSVRTKVLAAFGIVSVIAVVVGALTVSRVNDVAADADTIQTQDVTPLALVGDLHAQLWQSSSDGIVSIFI